MTNVPDDLPLPARRRPRAFRWHTWAWAISARNDVSGKAKHLARVLADEAGVDDGRCWIPMEDYEVRDGKRCPGLKRQLGVADYRTVARHRQELERIGAVSRVGSAYRGRSQTYELRDDPVTEGERVASSPPFSAERVAYTRGKGGRYAAPPDVVTDVSRTDVRSPSSERPAKDVEISHRLIAEVGEENGGSIPSVESVEKLLNRYPPEFDCRGELTTWAHALANGNFRHQPRNVLASARRYLDKRCEARRRDGGSA